MENWEIEFEAEFQLLTFERKEVDFMEGKYWMNFPSKNEIKQFISTQIEKAKEKGAREMLGFIQNETRWNDTEIQSIWDKFNNLKIKTMKIINEEFVKIDYSIIPKELFDKYGIIPFEIQKKKMRKENGEVWGNINYFDAQKECEKLGCRLPNIQEMLLLLEFYKTQNKTVSCNDKKFLNIEELSYQEDVVFDWIYFLKDVAFERGGNWTDGAYAGVFTLNLNNAPTSVNTYIGFRCVR